MLALIAYIGTIVGANWAIETFGIVSIGGLAAPAGVFFAGLSFSARDALQEQKGRAWTIGAIGAGALLSLAISAPFVAAASAAAFAASETADMAIYTPLRDRGYIRAVVASNLVGSVVDSALFLFLAFGSLDYLFGQVVLKWLMIVPVIGLMWLWRSRAGRSVRSRLTRTGGRSPSRSLAA